jgi:septum formation protein
MKTISEMKIVLASGSPRRQKILSAIGLEFEVAPQKVREELVPGESPVDHVRRLSWEKAEAASPHFKDHLIIGADTIVVLDDTVFGKPQSEEDAKRMLSQLSGRTHTVITGLSLVVPSEKLSRFGYDSTRVTFNNLSPEDMESYIASGEPMDKAGAYGIQGMGSFLVSGIEGELDTVIGFPSRLFETMFEDISSCLKR